MIFCFLGRKLDIPDVPDSILKTTGKEVTGVKKVKALDSRTLEKEAIFWGNLKRQLKENPVKICRK